MAKDKKGSKAATSVLPSAVSKPLDTVKAGRVAKPVENVKAVAKDAAKKANKEIEKVSKKAKKDPTPEPSDDDEDDTSESSASSDDQMDQDEGSDSDSSSESDSDDNAAVKKADAPKVNGNGTAQAEHDDSDTSDASDSEDEVAPKMNGKAKAASDSEEDSGSESGSESDSESDDEVDAKAGAEKVADTNGAKDDDSDTSDASSSDDESDEETVPVKTEEVVKKRKAEDSIDQTPKKTKVMVNGEEKEATMNLFVGNLSWNIDEEWLTREFEEFGELSGVRIITDRESGRSKGFGYVEFTEVDNAAKALEAKNGEMLDGRNIRVDFGLPRQQKNDNFTPQQRSSDRAQRYGDTPKEPSTTLFVGNVSFDADESMLSELFQDYGTLSAVRLPTDKATGQMKGFGYVEYTSIDDAKAAFDALQGAEIAGRPVRLDFASARTNNESPGNGRWTRGAPRGRGGFSDRGGRGGFSDRGGRGGFGDRGRGRGGARGGRGSTTNRGGFGDFSGKKISF